MGEYVRLSLVLLLLLVLGTAACLPFYKWNVSRLVRSQLFVKCMMWIPIYAVFTVIIASAYYSGVIVAGLIFVAGVREYKRQIHKRSSVQATTYMVLFCLWMLCMAGVFVVLGDAFRPFVIAVGISSVLSDVVAFFGGKFLGVHALPRWINPGKSWEGVGGQVVGGVVGMAIVIVAYGTSLGLWFGVVIGCASAVGDVANSIAKRSLGIKDWSRAIPGHGGFLDRFSSLSAAFAAAFLVVLIEHLPRL